MKRPSRPKKAKPARRAAGKIKDFKFDDASPPKGMAYQWAPDPKIDPLRAVEYATYERVGWKPVAARRHPTFPSSRGKIAHGGMILMQIKEAKQRELRDAAIAAAQQQMREMQDLFGMNDPNRGRSFPMVSSDFMVSSKYETVAPDADAVDVAVTVNLRLSRRLQDAAAALKMTLEQYAQARMTLFVRGGLAGLLLPAVDPNGFQSYSALELYEAGQFTLNPRI